MNFYATKNAKKGHGDKEYHDKYKKWLDFYWECIDTNPYVDPDQLENEKERSNPYFYEDLCIFLNQRQGRKYQYNKENDKYIHDDTGVQLVSDQFGFSAPKIQLTHPYDVYLQKCKREGKDKDIAIENVIHWIMTTRSIGGSFLWPDDIWKTYNTHRGSRSYIQDRVDLTLLEIKHYLDNKGNVEKDVLKVKDKSNGQKWLADFSSFKEYVNYFFLDPFVDKKNGYIPYDIVRSNMEHGVPLDEEVINKYKKQSKWTAKYLRDNSILKLNTTDLERMFNNVCKMIEERSEKMEEAINRKD